MSGGRSAEPSLLVTLRLDDDAAAEFEALRRRHYPPDRNRVPAHVMLFHRLPFERRDAIARHIKGVASPQVAFGMDVRGPRSIGSGIVYDLESTELQHVRAALAERWDGDLVAQDRERYRPHVVVQNKAAPATVRETLDVLRTAHARPTARATGVVLWTYRAGSWSDPETFAFR